MTEHRTERILILAPVGRDAAVTADLLAKAGLEPHICRRLEGLVEALAEGAAAALVAEEALFGRDLEALTAWLAAAPAWSDFPFVILTSHRHDPRVAAWRQKLVGALGNVALVERPIHAITLTSTLQAALRARHRQYEVRTLLEARERAAAQLQHRVDEATAELRAQMAERAHMEDVLRQAQKMEAIGQLTGGVAHDFNNLLMVIVAGLDMIERHRHSERFAGFVESMRTATQRGAALTRQLLAFARRQTLKPEPVDLARHLGNMRELLGRGLGANIRLVTTVGRELWPVHVDPTEFELVMLNLAFNARDAMPDGGTITVSGRNLPGARGGAGDGGDADFVELTVADTGVGMTAEVQARAFEPFFTTKEIGKGSGLGLAQTYGFARQSGGTVRIESEPGKGTRITLTLPRAPSEAKAMPGRPAVAPPATAEGGSAGHVLLVEDDDAVAQLVSEMLSQLGYHVVRTASAQAALGALADRPDIDVVFSDIMMPGGMDGITLARELRKRCPDLPVVLTTGHPAAVALETAAKDLQVLAKPYRIEELDAILSRARRTGSDASAMLQTGRAGCAAGQQ